MGAIIKRSTLKPTYYKDFQCIGGACEASCCNRLWRIVIDKNTYTKYRNSKDPIFREKVDSCVKRIRKTAGDRQYAEFVLEKGSGKCPFHAEGGLCEIHRDMGEKYLSLTCKVYPRIVRTMANGEYDLEFSISMSCPHAVRIALFEEEPMEFESTLEEFDAHSAIVLAGIGKPEQAPEPTHYIENGWSMREAAVTILQDRAYSISDRILIIGMMLSKVVRLHDEGKHEEIGSAIRMYRDGALGGAYDEMLGSFELNELMQYKAASALDAAIVGKRQKYPAFAEVIKRFTAYLEQPDPSRPNGKIDVSMHFHAYCKLNADELWDGFLDRWAHVLENYLVNFIFSEMFPLKYHGKGLNPYHHVLILAEQYALLKIIICGNYDEEEGFTKQYITRMISQVAEMNQHSEDPLKIAQQYKAADLDGLPYLYHLLA